MVRLVAFLFSLCFSFQALSQQSSDPYRAAISQFQACLRDSAKAFDDEKSDIVSVARAVLSICGKEHDAMISEMAKKSGGAERLMELRRTLRDSILDDAAKAVLLSRFNKKPKP